MTYPDCSPLVRLSLAGLLNLFFFKVHASELNTWNLTIRSRSCWLIHHHTPKGFWAILVSFRSIKIVQNRTFSDIKFSHSTKSNGQVQAWDHWIDNTALRAAYLVEADLGSLNGTWFWSHVAIGFGDSGSSGCTCSIPDLEFICAQNSEMSIFLWYTMDSHWLFFWFPGTRLSQQELQCTSLGSDWSWGCGETSIQCVVAAKIEILILLFYFWPIWDVPTFSNLKVDTSANVDSTAGRSFCPSVTLLTFVMPGCDRAHCFWAGNDLRFTWCGSHWLVWCRCRTNFAGFQRANGLNQMKWNIPIITYHCQSILSILSSPPMITKDSFVHLSWWCCWWWWWNRITINFTMTYDLRSPILIVLTNFTSPILRSPILVQYYSYLLVVLALLILLIVLIVLVVQILLILLILLQLLMVLILLILLVLPIVPMVLIILIVQMVPMVLVVPTEPLVLMVLILLVLPILLVLLQPLLLRSRQLVRSNGRRIKFWFLDSFSTCGIATRIVMEIDASIGDNPHVIFDIKNLGFGHTGEAPPPNYRSSFH